MISLSNINKTFNKGTPLEIKALEDINLEIKTGTFNIVIGANGSGKSTLLNILAGNIFPDSGRIMLNNAAIQKLPCHLRSKFIARIFQNPVLGTAPDLSLLDNFKLAAVRTRSKTLSMNNSLAFKNKVIESVAGLGIGLEKRIHQPMDSFSGGQRQALALLMATFDDLQVLLLDEPTAALDPVAARTVMQLADRIIRERNLTGIMVTHDLKHCIDYGNSIIQMHQGRVIRVIEDEQKAGITVHNLYSYFED
jgi:putative tryptophan/tyrosine transport system ATP-binding protein